jgi:hypothetical protein
VGKGLLAVPTIRDDEQDDGHGASAFAHPTSLKTNRFYANRPHLRSPPKRSEGGRLEGWQLARWSSTAILRDAANGSARRAAR